MVLGFKAKIALAAAVLYAIPVISRVDLFDELAKSNSVSGQMPSPFVLACEANWQNGGCGTPTEVNGTNHGGSSTGTANRRCAC